MVFITVKRTNFGILEKININLILLLDSLASNEYMKIERKTLILTFILKLLMVLVVRLFRIVVRNSNSKNWNLITIVPVKCTVFLVSDFFQKIEI